jgi:FMN phosphatase YigB (HAD superfamily)
MSQADKVTGTGLDRLVDGWVVSDELGARKPDPRIFAEAALRCGGSLDGGWMVGDSAPADMVGAWRSGLRSVWLHRGRSWADLAAEGRQDPWERELGLASSWPTEPFEPDHQADGPLDAIEIVLGSGVSEPEG